MSNEEVIRSPNPRRSTIISALNSRNSNRRETQKFAELLIGNPYVKNYLKSVDDNTVIQNEVRTLKRRMTKAAGEMNLANENAKKKEIPVVKKIYSPTDTVINDDTMINYYKGKPIFVDFLVKDQQNKKEVESFLPQITKELSAYKWSSLREKDRIYFLHNKAEFYNLLLKIVETSKIKNEELISNKNKEIKELQELIQERELKNKSSSYNKIDLMKKKENIDKLEQELAEFPSILEELDKKVKNCDQIILNYQNPSEGLSIMEIIEQLGEEKNRLNSEISKQNEVVSELDDEINLLQESINILDFKNPLLKKTS